MRELMLSSPLGDRRHRPGYDGSVSAATSRFDPGALDHGFGRGEVSLREVYDAHSSLVYSMCRRTLGEEAAKDATQDVFVSAWRKREQFDPSRGALGAWLVGITKRRIVDQLRSEGRHADRRADQLDDDRSPSSGQEPERVVDRMFAAHLLQTLPSRTRQVVELVYVHDLTHREVAERMGLPIGTVKSDARRGIMKIRDDMSRDMGVSDD
jgi:RNA polymerase sigma-70 factor (ECF subfamily)